MIGDPRPESAQLPTTIPGPRSATRHHPQAIPMEPYRDICSVKFLFDVTRLGQEQSWVLRQIRSSWVRRG